MTGSAERMKHGRALGWLAVVGVTVLVALAVVPTLSGVASATPANSPATASGSVQWAYGGEGWSNNSLQIGNATATYDAAFGWTVIFTATNTSFGTVELEEQRTVGITISATWSGPIRQLTYNYHAQEVDTAFANLTNQSTVYENGAPAAALGLDNASVAIQGAISQSISETVSGNTRSASLAVNAAAQGSVAFSPSLGLIPLNLTGANSWNSSADASGAAAWNVSYSWSEQGYNGTVGSGSGSHAGNVSVSGPVTLQGFRVHAVTSFPDHQVRTGVVLVVQGPFDVYDGFVFVPHAFDQFGGEAQPYASMSFGSAAIASGETLFVSETPAGLGVTAASTTFSANDAAINAQAGPLANSPTASGSSPGATVTGEPMTVPQAQAESNCLTSGCSAAASTSGGLLLVAVVGLVAVAIVATVGVVEWRAYARRRSQKGLVGGYGESWTNGVPPTGSVPGSAQAPAGPAQGPSAPQEPFGPR